MAAITFSSILFFFIMDLSKIVRFFIIITFIIGFSKVNLYAQQQGQQLRSSQQFRMGERIIRVAEPGQLADTINVWGDVGSPGRYLIPRSTTLPELISYSFGPQTISGNQTQLDWSKMRIEVNISEYSSEKGMEGVTSFQYRLNEPLPEGMRTFDLENNQVVALQVKRRPSIVDYMRVIGPIVSTVATTILLIDRL